MSNIVIDQENFSRYAKRLQKNSEKYGTKLSLAQSQELLATTLGCANLFELQKVFSQTMVSREQEFISKYKAIINQEPAIAKSCIYIDFGNMIIDIIGWNEDQCYSIYFGSEKVDELNDFKRVGIPSETSQKMVDLFNEYNPVEKYAGLLFGSNVRKLMLDEAKQNSTSYHKDSVYFKNNLFSHEKIIDNAVYLKRHMIVTDKGFKNVVKKLHPSGEYCIMSSERHPGFSADEKEARLEQIKKNDSILIEYYSEVGATYPKCLLTRFWTSIDGVIQEYSPADYQLQLSS